MSKRSTLFIFSPFDINMVALINRAIASLEASISEKKGRLSQLAAKPIDPQTVAKTIKEFNNARTMWKTRKDLCLESIEMLAEGMEKPVKWLLVC
jgi:hypothetical protein